MIQQYVLAMAAGSAVTALLAFAAHKLHSAKLTARLRAEAQASISRLEAERADHGAAIRSREQAEQELLALTTQLREDLAQQSFYELLNERQGIVIARGTQTIEPTVTSQEEADLLGVPVHSPAFLFERTTEGQRGEVVEFVRSVYRGDRYRLVTELRPALR